jgi:predicted P-loop ATPase
MTHRIPAALLEQIKERVPISRLVGEYVAADKHKSQPGDLWGLCPIHKERTPSFHAEDALGRAHCFGCGFSADHFEFVERMDSLSFRDAVAKVGAMAGITVEGGGEVRDLPPMPVREPTPDPYAGYEFIPAPADAQPIIPGKRTPKLRNPKKGTEPTYTPEAVYPYYNADGELVGYDLRVIIEGQKITPTILWAKNGDWQGWCHGRLPKMPILGLEDVLRCPDKQVLVVEGGKCRDAAREALGGRVVVVSWCGGTNSVKGTDWTPLEGRSLLLWPDHDEGGYKAMHEVVSKAKPKRAKWVRSYPIAKGADVADLIADGQDVAAYIRANISENALIWMGGTILEKKDGSLDSGRVADSNPAPSNQVGRSQENDGPSGPSDKPFEVPQHDKGSGDDRGIGGVAAVRGEEHEQAPLALDDDEWQNYLIHNAKGDGIKSNSIQNAQLLIQYHENFKGCFAFNEFNREVMLMRKPVWHRGGKFSQRVVNEDDYTALQGHLEYQGISMGVDSIERAVRRVAKHNAFNPVVETLEGLVWDGVERLTGKYGWLTRYMGAAPTEINKIFGRKFLIAGCARIMEPGCQVDTVLIIEGPQGTRKSSSLRALCSVFGNDYFLDSLPDPYSKDGKMAVQGKLIVELAELEAFSRSEVRQEKAYITTRIDEFRRPFGRQVEKFPRTFLLTGSSNPTDTGYLKDSTGGRRFWPVLCGEIDFALLQEDAGQLWAEAYAAYKAGEQWWLTPEEDAMAEVEQRARYKHDPWAPLIEEHIRELMLAEVTPNKMLQMLDVSKKDRTVYNNDRVVSILKMLGWKRDGAVYRKPS